MTEISFFNQATCGGRGFHGEVAGNVRHVRKWTEPESYLSKQNHRLLNKSSHKKRYK